MKDHNKLNLKFHQKFAHLVDSFSAIFRIFFFACKLAKRLLFKGDGVELVFVELNEVDGTI
jgi:hypothetical protein